MSDFGSRLERELLAAGERRRDALAAGRWYSRITPKLLALWVAGVVLVGAPALAATGLWHPTLGDGKRPAPSSSDAGVPAEQRTLLGVLRRAQNDGDRAAAKTALSVLTPGVSGVRVGAIRALRDFAKTGPIILVPVQGYDRPDPAAAPATPATVQTTKSDGLCLFAADLGTPTGTPDGGGFACFSTAQVRTGQASGGIGRAVYALVPDDVATVRLQIGKSVENIAVRDNLVIFTAPSTTPSTATFTLTWLTEDGAAPRTITRPAAPPAGTRTNTTCAATIPADQCAMLKRHDADPIP